MVSDAVVVAAGQGTRMLPASLYTPKEALPLIDTPILNHIILEAVNAGATTIHLVLSEEKFNFFHDFLLDGPGPITHGRFDLPLEALSLRHDGVTINPVIQEVPKGVGDGISKAINHINGPFLVLLGDMLVMDAHHGPSNLRKNSASNASKRLVSAFDETGLPCVGVSPVGPKKAGNYGVVDIVGGLVDDIKEKPKNLRSEKNYVLSGRYIFPENSEQIFQRFPVEEHGELQSIAILKHIAETIGLYAVKLDGMQMYDSGNPTTWLKAQIDHAIRRSDTKNEILDHIYSIIQNLK